MQAIFETAFDVIYLCTVITLGIIMICKSNGRKQYLLYGIMAVTLGAGDSFHLVPRAVALCTTGLESYTAALGIGKLITSVTMTAFYVLLYYVWRCRYKITGKRGITAAVWGLSALRVILSYAAEQLDKPRRSAFLGDLPQYPVCAPRTAHYRADIQKRPPEQRP